MPKSNNYNLRIRIPKESDNHSVFKRIENGYRLCRKNEIKPVIAVEKIHHTKSLENEDLINFIFKKLNIEEKDKDRYVLAKKYT